MNKLAELISTLPTQEVQLIKRDLDEGNLGRAIENRLRQEEHQSSVCPVCSTTLSDNAPYVLYFGTAVRKKARFDALDCLEFFLKEMKK
jgi:hypothetical protein